MNEETAQVCAEGKDGVIECVSTEELERARALRDASDGRKAAKWIAIALIVLGLLFLTFWAMIMIEADEFVPIPFWVGMISLLLGAASAIYYKRSKRSA